MITVIATSAIGTSAIADEPRRPGNVALERVSGADELNRDALDRTITKAIAYLQREVTAWPQQNDCFSCHNNGDGARALIHATTHGWPVPSDTLAATVGWLNEPDAWTRKNEALPLDDTDLALYQFTATAQAAAVAGIPVKRASLLTACRSLAALQTEEGSWPAAKNALVGNPTTYGTPLATTLVTRCLQQTDARTFAAPVSQARSWMRQQRPRNILNAAALLGYCAEETDAEWKELQEHCRELILAGQHDDGGWGPFANVGSEPFDTAIVLLAFNLSNNRDSLGTVSARARDYLASTQNKDGSWPETTRPANGESYAQRISTTAWCLTALLYKRENSESLTEQP
ncbi:MAG: hypothetical protein KDA99_05025 [Planctomycetales bacterium]|nr:hypothetical protein [Planctomycetales bacterium]